MIASHRVRRAALVAALLAAPGLQAAEVAGIRVDDTLKLGGGELLLNGAGLRSRLFIKVYVGALYVAQKSTTPAGVIDSPGQRRMVMRMLREMDAETLHGALEEGLQNNLSAGELAELKLPAEQLGKIMKGIGKVKEGDSIAIDFSADGVAVSLNGESRGKVAGVGFGKALLKVWLGDKPADASLKKALLGI